MATDTQSRDIDLVLITGAGASRSFGAEKPFPLMAEWSDYLIKKVVTSRSPSSMAMRSMLAFGNNMDGPTFEAALGNFLRRAQAFREVTFFLKPSLDIANVRQEFKMQMQSGMTALEEWHHWTEAVIDELIEMLNQTLFEQFAGWIDEDAAAAGYAWLLGALEIKQGTPWIYATTNYDVVGETALKKLGLRVDWGRPPQLLNPSADEILQVEGLIDGIPRYVPILHLHGRIGWYLRPGTNDGLVRDMIVNKYNKEWGTPIVMWPDDRKDTSSYQATQVINQLWQQFEQALGRARRVLVLGHSLHDELMVRAIRERARPDRVAVSVYPRDSQEYQTELDLMKIALPGATFLPIEFGPKANSEAEIARWVQRTKV